MDTTQSKTGQIWSSSPIIIQPSKGWISLQLHDLWNYRELLYFLIWRDIKVRYKQSVLGVAWAIFKPLLTMIIFTIFFGKLVKVPTDGIPYPIFAFTALLPWQFFAQALSESSNSLVMNQELITKVYFPRLVTPFAAALVGLVDFCLAFIVLIAMMYFYGIHLSATILLVPVFVFLAIITALAFGLWLSALNVRYRDIHHVIPFITQVWLFLSPIVYPISVIPEKWRALYFLNPMVVVIEGFRGALLGNMNISNYFFIISISAMCIIFFGGLIYFKRMERTFADVV